MNGNCLLYANGHVFGRRLFTVAEIFERAQQFRNVLNCRGQLGGVEVDFAEYLLKKLLLNLVYLGAGENRSINIGLI